jgi:hypothetical protein
MGGGGRGLDNCAREFGDRLVIPVSVQNACCMSGQ